MNGRRFNFGLTAKLVGIVAAVALAVVGVILNRATSQLADTLHRELESKGEAIALALASTLSSNTEDTLLASISAVKGQIDDSRKIAGVRYVYVQDKDGGVLVHTFTKAEGFPGSLKAINRVAPGETLPDGQRVKLAPDVIVEAPSGATRVIDVAAPIASGSLGAVHVGMNRGEIDRQIATLRASSLLSGGVLALVGTALVVLAVVVLVLRPLRRMTDAARRIAQGDLSLPDLGRRRNGFFGTDEVAHMAEAFDGMLGSLRELAAFADRMAQGDLTTRLPFPGQVARAFNAMIETQQDVVRRLAEISASLAGAAAEIYAASQEQEASATQQSSSVEEVSSTMQSLLDAAAHISESARGVLGNAERARETTEQTARKIAELSAHTNRITEILEVIRDIADRSDLLALNASLEGTRAGEAGRGFSLVAAEMRRLAERVTAGVQDVKSLVADVRASGSSTVMATEEGRKLAENTTESARQITLVTQQQRTGTEQVSQSMKDISAMLTQSASATRQTRALAEDLKHHADRLSEMVGRFKVDRKGHSA